MLRSCAETLYRAPYVLTYRLYHYPTHSNTFSESGHIVCGSKRYRTFIFGFSNQRIDPLCYASILQTKPVCAVPQAGLEPARLSAKVSKTLMTTISNTRACFNNPGPHGGIRGPLTSTEVEIAFIALFDDTKILTHVRNLFA